MKASIPLFSLVYTSVRPNLIPQVFKLWNERSSFKDHEWCIGIDAGDTACAEACRQISEHLDPNQCKEVTTILNNGPKTCVAGWNIAATVSCGKILIAVADDFVPPVGWDQLLLSAGPKGWEDGEYVMKVEDGYVHNIFVLSILTRKRYERFGYLFYPKYPSMFNDTEFGDVALRDGVVINAEHLLFEHMHPDCGKRPRDTVDLHHASRERWNIGEQLYNFRKAQGFPIDDGPLAAKYAIAETIKPEPSGNASRYVAYMQVIKNDFCLLEVCNRLVEEGVHDFCFAHPDKYWSGESIEPESSTEVDKVVDALRLSGQTVHHKSFDVASYTMPGDSRILVETRVRNASLEWIRSLGYQHILIVDGDELWIRGTLDIVKTYVEQGRLAISVHMIPVIGVPGYPVEGATDVAVVYIGGDATFKVCRSPFLPQAIVYKPCIYHFTGTRKGMEETIKKHRRGGHYDDPDYDFEGWIERTLPNIKPGFEGAHMFKPRQIWPKVRAWRSDELTQMPESVRPFLGGES